MQLFVNVLCFLAGVVVTLGVLVVMAAWQNMQDKVRHAEEMKAELEAEQKRFLEEQVKAQEEVRKALDELIRRRPASMTQQQPISPQVPNDPNVNASVKDRLRKAVEITSKQIKIDTRKGPEFVLQHNELELEKLAVLRTILADGFDPVITIRYPNGEQEMLLSAYVNNIQKGLM